MAITESKAPNAMPEPEFWAIIDEVRSEASGDFGVFAEALGERLEAMSADQVLTFGITFSTLEARAYRWDLWGAAYVINGGCSDDGFVYFRRWLIAQGRKVWDAALAAPDSLAETTPAQVDAEFEELAYIAVDIYRLKTGRELRDDCPMARHPSQPAGADWREEDLDVRFPMLTAKFG